MPGNQGIWTWLSWRPCWRSTGCLFLKPCNGSLGRGIIYAQEKTLTGGRYYISIPVDWERMPSQSARAILERTAAVRKEVLIWSKRDWTRLNTAARHLTSASFIRKRLAVADRQEICEAGGWRQQHTNLSSGVGFLTHSRLMRYLYRGEHARRKLMP